MFGISMWEVVLILVVALIVLGPKQLTETARVLGKLYREIQKMASDVRNSVDLDALTSTDHYPEPSAGKPESAESPKKDQTILAPLGEKSGPDFYADLLESSKEEKPEGGSTSSPHEPEESVTNEAQKDGASGPSDPKNASPTQAASPDAESKPREKS